MLKKALFVDENRNQIKPRTGFLQFHVKTKKVCKCFASLSQNKRILHMACVTALIRPSHEKRSNRSCSIRNYAKVFRRIRAFAVVVTSRSSSFEYTLLVHAVHAGSERNVCNIVVSTETHQTTTNPSQTSTLTPAPPQILTSKTLITFSSAFCADTVQIYLKCTCIYVSVHEILSFIACALTQISLRIFEVSPDLFGCSHTLQSMDVDKDKTKL